MRELSLYVHIPFCVRKCLYCDFLSFSMEKLCGAAADEKQEKEKVFTSYVNLLKKEIRAWGKQCQNRRVISIFFGGGTPSLLPHPCLHTLMQEIRSSFVVDESAEITMEMNPGTVTQESLSAYRTDGINRLSIGLQSASDEELTRIGRIHTYAAFEECFRWARKTGFSNINVDLMAALPGQSMTSYRRTLERVCALSPEHISAYSLILEEGTPLYERQELYHFPSEEEDREMYLLTEKLLGAAGYQRYEISNYAKDGYACRHNQVYWTRGDYLGLGLGAASMMENRRWQNPADMAEYGQYCELAQDAAWQRLNGWESASQALSHREQMEEFMFLGLRLTEGVSRDVFHRTFGLSVEEVYGQVLEKHMRQGLLQMEGDRIFLTGRGLDVSNYVMSDFLLDEK